MVVSKIFRYNQFCLILNCWIKTALLSFLCFNALHLFSQQHLTITDCNFGEPISDVIITSNIKKSPLGSTNHKGVAEWKRSEESTVLNFKKLGSLDTNVIISPRQTTLCLHQKVNELERVEIEGTLIPLHKQFEQFIEKTVSVLPIEDDSLYYYFQYTLEVPDSGWRYHFVGELMIPTKSYKRADSGGCGGRFCTLRIKVDSDFYDSDLFVKSNTIEIANFYRNYDLIRKRFPYRTKIKEEMIEGKKLLGDSTLFFVKDSKANEKYTFKSSPVFNADSILIQDNVIFEQFDKSSASEDSPKSRRQESIIKYRLENELRIESLNVEGGYIWKGVNYKFHFQTQLLDKRCDPCANISFFARLNEAFFEKHPEIELEFMEDE